MPDAATVLVLGTLGIWLVLDLWLYYSGRKTVSQVFWRWSRVSAAVVFAAGLLVGHWFFPAQDEGEE
jgi:hypothetical protein